MAPWKEWALDCSAWPVTLWVPVELDEHGEIESVVFGYNLITDKPPGKIVAVVHPDGQEAVETWMADPKHVAWLESLQSDHQPNAETLTAIEDAETGRNLISAETMDDLFKALEDDE